MKGMMGGSSLATVSLYARWFLDGSCGKSHTVLSSVITVLIRSIAVTAAKRFILTYHQVFKFPIKLSELVGKFLWKQIKLMFNLRSGQNNFDCRQVLTSQVWFSLHTAGLLSPIVIAKKAFKFLYSLQLWQKKK